MVKIPRTLIALPLATILAGCGALTAENNVAELQQAPRVGSPFTAALAEEYREFSLFESEQMYDWPDADHFARKGLAAASGTVVEPERVENWNLPAGKVDELSNARTRLVTVLDAGARDRAPELAARAQGSYDCWVEQQEENHQPDHIAACREKFEQAMAELEKPQPAAAPASDRLYRVLRFRFVGADAGSAGHSARGAQDHPRTRPGAHLDHRSCGPQWGQCLQPGAVDGAAPRPCVMPWLTVACRLPTSQCSPRAKPTHWFRRRTASVNRRTGGWKSSSNRPVARQINLRRNGMEGHHRPSGVPLSVPGRSLRKLKTPPATGGA